MIEIDRHIEILLLSNDCVIVPGLGGFMTHHVEARYDDSDHMFLPPLRTLGFNPKLTMNDSLLAQSYVEAYDISYPEAVRRIENEVEELKQHLQSEGCYELTDIGTLSLNEEGHYEFAPCEAGILTPSLYGLSTFEMPRRHEALEKHITTRRHSGRDAEGTITIKLSWLRNAVAVAAAIVVFFLLTTPIANSDMSQLQSSSILPISMNEGHKAVKPASKPAIAKPAKPAATVQEAAPEAAVAEAVEAPEPQPATPQPEAAQPEPLTAYCIVLASQVTQRNAESYVSELAAKGFTEASVFKRNKIVRVVYGSYPTESDAQTALRSLRADSHFAEAWVLKK